MTRIWVRLYLGRLRDAEELVALIRMARGCTCVGYRNIDSSLAEIKQLRPYINP